MTDSQNPTPEMAGDRQQDDTAPLAATAIPEEAVREEVRRIALPQVQHALGFQVAMGPPPNAFIEKLQPEHITTILDHTKADKTQEHWRQILFFYGGVIGFLLLCGIFLYAGKDASLEKIISAFIGFVGGFGVGKWVSPK